MKPSTPSTLMAIRDNAPRDAISSSVGAKLLEASDIGISPFAQNVAQVQGQVNGFTCGDKRTFALGPFGQLGVEVGDGFFCGGRGRGHVYILTKGLCGALVAGRIRRPTAQHLVRDPVVGLLVAFGLQRRTFYERPCFTNPPHTKTSSGGIPQGVSVFSSSQRSW